MKSKQPNDPSRLFHCSHKRFIAALSDASVLSSWVSRSAAAGAAKPAQELHVRAMRMSAYMTDLRCRIMEEEHTHSAFG
jgi:hypothetical protein